MMYTIERYNNSGFYIIYCIGVRVRARVCVNTRECVHVGGSCYRASGTKKLHNIILQIFILLLNLSPAYTYLKYHIMMYSSGVEGIRFELIIGIYIGLLIYNPSCVRGRGRARSKAAVYDIIFWYIIIYCFSVNSTAVAPAGLTIKPT